MPQEITDRDHLGPMFQEVGRKGVPQTMATRGDPSGFGVALHLLLDRFEREGLPGAFAVPKDLAQRSVAWMLVQALAETGHHIWGHIHAAILAPFALENAQGLLLPIDLLQGELGDLGDPQATAEHAQKQGAVQGMGDLRKEPLDLRSSQGFGEGAPAPDKMTGLDRIARHPLLVEAKVKKMFQRIEAAVDRGPRAAELVLPFDKLVNLVKGDAGERHGDLGEQQAQINRVTRDRGGGELAPCQVRLKPVDGGLADIVHRLPPL
jgi:hypothetical protein